LPENFAGAVAPRHAGATDLRRMAALRAEGLAGAYHDDGDYMPLRLYWLRGFSALPFLNDTSFRAPLPPVPEPVLHCPPWTLQAPAG